MRESGAIHARHMARVRGRQDVLRFRLEVRHWRRLLEDRERLLRKLVWLDRRLAHRGRDAAQRHLPSHIYEIDGTWFRQAGRRRPAELRIS